MMKNLLGSFKVFTFHNLSKEWNVNYNVQSKCCWHFDSSKPHYTRRQQRHVLVILSCSSTVLRPHLSVTKSVGLGLRAQKQLQGHCLNKLTRCDVCPEQLEGVGPSPYKLDPGWSCWLLRLQEPQVIATHLQVEGNSLSFLSIISPLLYSYTSASSDHQDNMLFFKSNFTSS